MTDCPSAEIRDRLPDLLHDRLDANARAAVEAHVAGCVDCQAELEVLRGVQSSLMARTPRVNVNAIVAALPAPPANTGADAGAPIPLASRRRQPWFDWRVAASIAVLAIGAGAASYELVRHSREAESPARTNVAVAPPAVTPVPTPAPTAATPSSPTHTEPTAASEPAMVATATEVAPPEQGEQIDIADAPQLGKLNQSQLKALLDNIDRMPATPVVEGTPSSIRIDVKSDDSPSPEGL